MRLFIGIPLAETVVSELSAISARFQSNSGSLRWPSPETWHITLQFLGNTSPDQYNCVVKWLREIQSPPVPIYLENVGFFDRAGIFFAGVHVTPELVSLQQLVVAATGNCGFAPEERPYHPHITLARAKGPSGSRDLYDLKRKLDPHASFTAFVAEEFLLYESFTLPTGSEYEIRDRFPLPRR